MSLVPFLILGVGAAWVGLMVAMRDRRVTRTSPWLRLTASFVGFVEGMNHAARVAAEFQRSLEKLTAALAIDVAEADRRMREAMRSLPHVETPEDARARIMGEWARSFARKWPSRIVQSSGLD